VQSHCILLSTRWCTLFQEKSFQIFQQLPTTRNNLSLTLIHTSTFSKIPNTVRILSFVSKHHCLLFATKHHFIMSSKSNTHAFEENVVAEPQESGSSVPKMMEPITMVPPLNRKRKPPLNLMLRRRRSLQSQRRDNRRFLTP